MKSLRMGTIVGSRRAGVKAIGLVLLAGCTSRQPGFPPVDAAQRASAVEAAGKLRDAFNTRLGCEAIYDGAGQRFQIYAKERWLADCARLQSDLGSWQTFRAASIDPVWDARSRRLYAWRGRLRQGRAHAGADVVPCRRTGSPVGHRLARGSGLDPDPAHLV
jgi:hypothetical protein